MSRSEGRTGEYMNATSARETFMSIGTYPNRTVSDRLSSRRPWSLNEDGRDCDPSLSRGNVSQSQQLSPRLIIWVVCRNG